VSTNLEPTEEAPQLRVGKAVRLGSELLAPADGRRHFSEDRSISAMKPGERIPKPVKEGLGLLVRPALCGENILGSIVRTIQRRIQIEVRENLVNNLLKRPCFAGGSGFPLLDYPPAVRQLNTEIATSPCRLDNNPCS
jgi:hypothetical protein